MSSNLEVLKKYVRANALRRLNNSMRRRSGHIFSFTQDDLVKIADQMKRACSDIATAEYIADEALVDQSTYNSFMDKVWLVNRQRFLSVFGRSVVGFWSVLPTHSVKISFLKQTSIYKPGQVS